MTKQLRIFLCAALLSCLAVVTTGQSGVEHKTLENIYLEGAERMTPDSFLNLISLRPGQMYTDEDVRREFYQVWDSGLFDDLWVEERDGSLGGRILVFHVVERPTVTQVNYEGLKRVTKADLTDKLREIDALVSGFRISFFKIKKTESLIRCSVEKGYGEATVRTESPPYPGVSPR